MTYFIDFDRTIFDTDAFKSRYGLMHMLMTFFATGRSGFAPSELQKYLYPDVPAFLEAHGADTLVVTYGVEAFIMAKVSSALAKFPLKRIVYTAEKKGHIMKKLCAEIPGPYRFIDDAVFQLASVARHCPSVELFEMRRDGRVGDGRWKVIHNLDEL